MTSVEFSKDQVEVKFLTFVKSSITGKHFRHSKDRLFSFVYLKFIPVLEITSVRYRTYELDQRGFAYFGNDFRDEE